MERPTACLSIISSRTARCVMLVKVADEIAIVGIYN